MARIPLLLIPTFLLAISGFAQDTTTSSSASPTPTTTNPTATLDQAIVNGVSASGVHKFLGIPYASPPVNTLRFAAPQPITSYNGTIDATRFGNSCPQQNASLVSSFFHFRRRGREFVPMKVDPHWTDVDFDDAEAPPESEDCKYDLFFCMSYESD